MNHYIYGRVFCFYNLILVVKFLYLEGINITNINENINKLILIYFFDKIF